MNAKRTLPAIRSMRSCGWLVLLAGCAGCSSSSEGTVSGKISYQGKPIPAGTVVFVPQKAGGSFVGEIHDGEYRVERLPLGEAKIAVNTPANAVHLNRVIGKMQPPPEVQNKLRSGAPAEGSSSSPPDAASTVSLPARFQDSEKSGLSYTVKSGSQVHNIDLSEK